jgi:hypothetical protein
MSTAATQLTQAPVRDAASEYELVGRTDKRGAQKNKWNSTFQHKILIFNMKPAIHMFILSSEGKGKVVSMLN